MPRPQKPDPAHAKTDEMLAGLERRIAEEYAQAAKDMASKYEEYMRKFEAGIAKQKSLLDAGEITKKDYTDWVYRHTLMTDRWKEMRDVLTKDLENSRDIARQMAGEQVPDVYALNHNYAVYDIEHSAKINTGLTLYNHDAAEYLLGDPRELMPGPSTRRAAEIARNKAMQWDKQKIQSAVLQGVLQGETSAQVAKRLQGVAEMGYNAAVRYARTMTTSAQNAGRYQAFHRAKKIGVELVIEWVAVLDSHTRHAHRLMHGQRRNVDDPFETPDGFTIYYPADCSGLSDAPQSEIWNCRCTLKPMVKGFERETVKSSPGMGDMSFEEWQNAVRDNTSPGIERAHYKPKQEKVNNPFSDELKTKGYVGLSGKESDEFIEEHHNKQIIAKNHRNTMEGSQSKRINKALRNNQMPSDEKDLKMITKLDKAIQKNQLPQDMTLFRGASISDFRNFGIFDGWEMPNVDMSLFKDASGNIDFDAWGVAQKKATETALKDLLTRGKKLVGKTVEENGFMFVSASSERNFFGFSNINIQLHAPKGMNAYISDYKPESEIILQRGFSYKILGVELSTYVGDNGNRMDNLQIIAQVV